MHRTHVLHLTCAALVGLGTPACSDDASSDSDSGGASADAAAGADSASSSDTSLQLVNLSGIVASSGDGGDDPPVSGATVSIVGGSGQVASGTDGSFTIQAANGALVFMRVQATGFLSSIFGLRVPASGMTDVELSLVTAAEADGAVTEAGLGTRDQQKGVIVVDFSNESGTGGEKVTLSSGTYDSMTFKEVGQDEQAIASDVLVADGDSTLVYFDVATGTTKVTPSSGCNEDLGAGVDYPVEAGTLTFVEIACGQ